MDVPDFRDQNNLGHLHYFQYRSHYICNLQYLCDQRRADMDKFQYQIKQENHDTSLVLTWNFGAVDDMCDTSCLYCPKIGKYRVVGDSCDRYDGLAFDLLHLFKA